MLTVMIDDTNKIEITSQNHTYYRLLKAEDKGQQGFGKSKTKTDSWKVEGYFGSVGSVLHRYRKLELIESGATVTLEELTNRLERITERLMSMKLTAE